MKISIAATFVFASQSLCAAEQWTGWLTDQGCVKTLHYAGAIHQKHIADGQALVFVDETDKKVYIISNASKVKGFSGEKVTLTGTQKQEGSIQADSAARAK